MASALLADRIQFAFTIMFHYLFPIATMGLAPFIVWYNVRALQTGNPAYDKAARFWTKIFAFNFVAGIVTGIPMEFQFGTNWAQFSARTGAVVGQALAMEGIYSFFLESVFLGILLYGRERVAPRFYVLSAALVWFGSWLSGYFIVVSNAWMQHPVGYALQSDGRVRLENLGAVLTSKFAWWQYFHVMTGAVVTGGFMVAGAGAFYLLARRPEPYGAMFVRAGVLVAFVFSIIAIFPTGHSDSADVTEYQPVKLAAMEGLFESKNGAPVAIIGMPDTKAQRLIDPIYAPKILSFLAYGNFDAGVKGLSAYRAEERPPVEVTYYAYHIMVGLGTIFLGLGALGALLWRLKRLDASRWYLWMLMLAVPFPFIANEAGWTVAEVGRQPWMVYGLMRTSAAASTNVAAGETIFTTLGFAGMYALLGLLIMLLVLREIGHGPEAAQ